MQKKLVFWKFQELGKKTDKKLRFIQVCVMQLFIVKSVWLKHF